MKQSSVAMRARCTTCRKEFEVTQQILREASDVGCLFSPCCHAVATLTQVTAHVGKRKTTNGRDLQ